MMSRGQRGPDHAPAQAEDVAVVVLDRLVGRVGVVGDDGADVRELARRDGDARARAADEHRAVGVAVRTASAASRAVSG